MHRVVPHCCLARCEKTSFCLCCSVFFAPLKR